MPPADAAGVRQPDDLSALAGRTVLITGARGMLGGSFEQAIARLVPSCRVVCTGREELDVTDRRSVMSFARLWPDYIIHCGARVRADEYETSPALAQRQLAGAGYIRDLVHETGAMLIYPQSVFIFDGSVAPITEETAPRPVIAYGKHKLEVEMLFRESCPDVLVARMAGFFGGCERDKNFVGSYARALAGRLREGQREFEVGDRVWQPTYTDDLARNILLLAARGKHGVYNLACHGQASFHELVEHMAECVGLAKRVRILQVPEEQVRGSEKARRPAVIMANERLRREGLDRQRPWRESLAEYLSLPYFRELFR